MTAARSVVKSPRPTGKETPARSVVRTPVTAVTGVVLLLPAKETVADSRDRCVASWSKRQSSAATFRAAFDH
jgi:hypothetical protein